MASQDNHSPNESHHPVVIEPEVITGPETKRGPRSDQTHNPYFGAGASPFGDAFQWSKGGIPNMRLLKLGGKPSKGLWILLPIVLVLALVAVVFSVIFFIVSAFLPGRKGASPRGRAGGGGGGSSSGNAWLRKP